MKKLFAIIALCIMLSGCAKPSAEAEKTTASAARVQTTAAPAQTTENTNETDDDEIGDGEALTDTGLSEMEAVDSAIAELMRSEEFTALDTPQKAGQALALLNELSENGTRDLAYPLIEKHSIYYDGDDMISFSYSCGALGGIKLEPFDPLLN